MRNIQTGNQITETDFLPYKDNSPRFLRWILLTIVTIFPGLILFSRNASDVCLFFLVFSAIGIAIARGSASRASFKIYLVRYWPLCLAMSSMFVAVFLNHLFVTGFRAKFYDLPLRFLVLPLIIYVLLSLPSRDLRNIQWGLIIGSLICAVFMYVVTKGGAVRPLIEDQTGYLLICFTNLSLLLGFLAFATIGWDSSHSRWIKVLKILALIAAVSTGILSQTRASWVSAIVLMVVVMGLFIQVNKKNVLIFLAVLAVACVAFFSFSSSFERFTHAKTDIAQYKDGTNRDTSIGTRLQLYQASWMIFLEHPFFGVGNANFEKEMEKVAQKGIISSSVAQSGHSHNELLNRMVWHGFFGGMAVILCTFFPLLYFFPHRRSQDKVLKTVSYMGMLFCTGFFLFGLSDSIYVWRGPVNYYVVILSILFALMIRRKAELGVEK